MRLGLTEYEARTYHALLEMGQATAGELARKTGIPRNRVYDTLDQLSTHGLVQIILAETRLFIPLPFESYLDRRIQDLEKNAEGLRGQKEEIAKRLKPAINTDVAATPGTIKLVKGSHSNDALLLDLVKKSETKLRASLTPGSVIRVLGDPEVRHELLDAVQRGVDVRLVVPPTEEQSEILQDAGETLGKVLRVARQPIFHVARVTVDDKQLYLRQPVGDEIRSRAEVGFISDSTILVADAEDHVNRMWEAGATIHETLRELETGAPSEWEEPTRDVATGVDALIRATEAAKTELLVMTDEAENFPADQTARIGAKVAEAVQRGVKFRLLTRVTQENVEMMQAAEGMGAEVRHHDRPDFRFQIVDDTFLLEMIAANEDGTGLLVPSTIRAKIQGFRSLFEERWRASIPLADRLSHLQEGKEAPKIRIYAPDKEITIWKQMRKTIKESVDCLSYPEEYEKYGRAALDSLREQVKLGVKYRFLIVGGTLSPDLEKTYAELGVEVRYADFPLIDSVVVVDGSAALVSPFMTTDAPPHYEAAFRWTSKHPQVVKSLVQKFEAAWKNATPMKA